MKHVVPASRVAASALLVALLALSPPAVAQTAAPAAPLRQMAKTSELHYLDPAAVEARLMFPPPPGAAVQRQELAFLHALIAATPPARIAQARADGKNETPALYSTAFGRDLATLPATWNLLVTIESETDAIVDHAKDVFNRPRPYQVDPTMPTCTHANPAKPTRSYPSGHAGVGFSMGWALARLVPARAPQILARADDFALSRLICGVHFPSDTTASRGVAMVVAERLLADPRLAGQVAAAKAELAGVR